MYYLEHFCFLCLKPGITTTLHNVDVEEKLKYLISTYQILQLSKIPKHFCYNCLENLNSFYDFKHKCMKSIVSFNYYVKKLGQENSTFAYLSVRLSDILQNIKSGTINSVGANVEIMNNELNDEIFAMGIYEQHETVEIQQGKVNKQVSIKMENEVDYFEMKREITEEFIIKDENFDNNDTTVDTSTNIENSPHGFSRLNTLKIHQRTHSDIKLNKCNPCKEIFNQKCNSKHHDRIHTEKKLYECDVCKKPFSRKSALNKHKRKHTGEKSYECDVCKKSFSKKPTLNEHKHIHTGEKPYECNVCKKSFNQKSTLLVRKRIHTGEKPYKCDVCKNSFSKKTTLILHKRKHTVAKPYECDVCKGSFGRESDLIMHKHIHTGENKKINVMSVKK